MSEKVGSIHYDVTLETGSMVDGQRKVQREVAATGANLDGLTSKLTKVASAVSVLALAMAALKSANLADDMRMLGAKIEVAAGSIESGASAMAALEAISKRTSTSVAANAEVFTRLNQSILQMGGTQQDTLNITELLGKAIRVSGASAVEAKSAMLQFGQALGSGKLAGDELRSLMENAPYLMRQLADGIGVPVGALKKLGEEGKLTSDVVTNALSKAATQIDADFQKFPQTIASAMDVAIDAAIRANSKFDDLTGTSTAMTGVIKGAGEVLDDLAKQFGAANDQAGELGRNEQVKTWADRTRTVLSYVADAADVVVRSFKVVGYTLAGLAAGAVQIASGNFSGAAQAFSASWSDAVSTVDAKLSGVQMRQAWAMGNGGGRGTVNPQAAASQLKSPVTDSGGKGKKSGAAKQSPDQKFDDEKYLLGLAKKTVDGYALINASEAEALRNNAKLLEDHKISRATYEKAITAIQATSAKERQDLRQKEDAENDAAIERSDKAMERAAQAASDAAKQKKDASDTSSMNTLQIKAGMGGEVDKENLIRAQADAELARVEAAQQLDLTNSQTFADEKVAIEAKMVADIQALHDATNSLRMAQAADVFDSLVSITKNAAGEQSGIYHAMFAAQKAFAIASAIVNIQTAMSSAAMSLPFPGNLAAMGIVAANTASIISTISGTSMQGRQYGGPVNANSMYRVNENGAPEMFTAGNGSQYMMPNASGKVTAADKIGGNSAPTVIIQNMGTGQQVQSQSYDQQSNTLRMVMADLSNQFASNSGQVWSALRSGSNVTGRM